jgi:hypothetical protein
VLAAACRVLVSRWHSSWAAGGGRGHSYGCSAGSAGCWFPGTGARAGAMGRQAGAGASELAGDRMADVT